MLNLLLFILFSVGLTNIVVNASILENIRERIEGENETFGKLTRCMLCTGFWVGLLSAPIFDYNLLIGAAIASLFSDLYSSAIEVMDTYVLNNAGGLAEDE